MAVPFSNTKLRVPNGFKNVVWVFAREVIRDNPKNIHEYGFRFFTKLLQIRAIEGHDPAQTGAHSEERFYNNWAYKESAKAARTKKGVSFDEEVIDIDLQGLDLNGPAMEHAAVLIQAQYKGFATRKKYSMEIEEKRHSVSENQREDTMEEIDIDLNDPAVEDAAVKIQAQFKGFKKRKDLERSRSQDQGPGTS
ncbi:sperm surface protein Sp17-like [Littorina saxatilis]|uniref:sperm surface protein Sp17-like n=1 Tax=Littorina saxatilis TaxID=31220 RepID=UPI0038B61A9A